MNGRMPGGLVGTVLRNRPPREVSSEICPYPLYFMCKPNNPMNKKSILPKRKPLPHAMPTWALDNSVYFITVCSSPKGLNQLCKEGLSESIWESIINMEKLGRWHVHYLLLMPDHLHGLFSFNVSYGLKNSITSWKRYTALNLGVKWQRDFFDHRIRNDESLERKIQYIAENPVRKGLVKKADEWAYAWGFGRDGSP